MNAVQRAFEMKLTYVKILKGQKFQRVCLGNRRSKK